MTDAKKDLDVLYDHVQSREPGWTDAAFELCAGLALIGDLAAARQVVEAIIDDAEESWSRARARSLNAFLVAGAVEPDVLMALTSPTAIVLDADGQREDASVLTGAEQTVADAASGCAPTREPSARLQVPEGSWDPLLSLWLD